MLIHHPTHYSTPENAVPGIDPERPFIPVRIAILTVSDTRTIETDRSGQLLTDRVKEAGHIVERTILPDDAATLDTQIRHGFGQSDVDVVISTGGTGLTGRDITPEVFEALYDKAIPGFGELFRYQSYSLIGTSTIQSLVPPQE